MFILTEASNRESLNRALLLLARRQHIVYLWNFTEPLGIRHINIRERTFPGIFPGTLLSLALFINAAKKEAKRYNLVFVDNPALSARLSKNRRAVYYVNIDRDTDKVCHIADLAAKDMR